MNLDEVVNLNKKIYAHRSDLGKEKELLENHAALCGKYFQTMIEEKGLKDVFHRFLRCYIGELSNELEAIFYQLLYSIPTLHDAGKINPLFQKEKMNHTELGIKEFRCLSGTRHSMLSSMIYIDYFFQVLKESKLDKRKIRALKAIAYLNSYVISRHHSDLGELKEYDYAFDKDGLISNMVSFFEKEKQDLYKGPFSLSTENVSAVSIAWKNMKKEMNRDQQLHVLCYVRLVYSLLVASDYYSTTEYMSGISVSHFGIISQKERLCSIYEECGRTKAIRSYQKTEYGSRQDFSGVTNMNVLRTELYLDVEKQWISHKDQSIFFLEAPTGSGKSNTSMNLSFQMLREGSVKIIYVYPFNTLVEQNLESLRQIFGNDEEVFSKISVINSITPIKTDEEELVEVYQKALLDRQFLNYPFILTTHVSFFHMLFGSEREAVFGFCQLAGSVVVLDEIQSYKNKIWAEIILFLKAYADMLNIKVIIMSATLPDLEYLTGKNHQVVKLVNQREKYFSHPLFKERVRVSYELLNQTIDLEKLCELVLHYAFEGKKVLIEFVVKDTAYEFNRLLNGKAPEGFYVDLITGDNTQWERKRILNKMNCMDHCGKILVATQVVEAGVDIDMDIGFKDISKLDSEEQFMGRINRSCQKSGMVYFFDLDQAGTIYGNDIRINKQYTLLDESMREILKNKDFGQYYMQILQVLKEQWNESRDENSLDKFFDDHAGTLDFPTVESRMRLIDEDDWHISICLCRVIQAEDGRELDGWSCWQSYKSLLSDQNMDYAEKQVKLSRIRSDMNHFIYQIKKNTNLAYSDRIGELYCIQDGEAFFEHGILNRKAFEQEVGMFIDI